MRFNEPFGICQNYQPYDSSKTIRKDINTIHKAGIRWLRTTFDWRHIEKRKGKFNFEIYDNLTLMAIEKKINLLPILAYSPSWAAKHWNFPPSKIKDFTDFVQTVVERYKKFIHYWEIWNEADSFFFWVGNPKEYCELLSNAYEAIKEIDLSCKVLVGGLSDPATPNKNFFSEILKSLDSFDIMNFHVYPEVWSKRDMSDWQKILLNLKSDSSPIEKPIWITEAGYGVLSRRQEVPQANFLIKTISSLLGTRVPERIFWHELRNNFFISRFFLRKKNKKHFGIISTYSILRKMLFRKSHRAYHAYGNLTRLLSQNFAYQSGVKIESKESTSLECFRNADSTVIILWNTSDQTRQTVTVRVPTEKKRKVTLQSNIRKKMDMVKGERELIIKNIHLTSKQPQFIVVKNNYKNGS
jgi:hypothetical protein